jgi:hypothetical protein
VKIIDEPLVFPEVKPRIDAFNENYVKWKASESFDNQLESNPEISELKFHHKPIKVGFRLKNRKYRFKMIILNQN